VIRSAGVFFSRKDEQKAELREIILSTARELVLQEGFAALSIRKLAEEISYTPGTIYLYFKDRDELVLEICVQGFAELSEELKSATDVADPLKRLVALLRAYAEFAVNSPETYRLSFMEDPKFTAEIFRRAPLDAESGAGRQAFAAVAKVVRELKKSGTISRREDENLLAEVLWAGVHGVVSLKLIYPAFPTNSTGTLVTSIRS
jgi:AcrR family transcriptional regulator